MTKRPEEETEHLPPDDEEADLDHEESEEAEPTGPPEPSGVEEQKE